MGMVVAVIRPDEDLFLSYGKRSAESDVPPDENDVFEIGSVTKVFTVLTLAELVRDESLSLATPVTEIIGGFERLTNKDSKVVTLEDLASHQSGLPIMPENFWLKGDNPFSHEIAGERWFGYDEEKLLEWTASTQFRFPKDPKYVYSNLGSGVLSVCLSRHTGKQITDLIEERVCQPLKMENTGFNVSTTLPGHLADLRPTTKWQAEGASFAGAYGLRSTAKDLASFGRQVMKMEEGVLGYSVVESS